ncbi:hypothetical protein EDB89DRAFT_1902058 [Lactarius sanguifluus]|nr:hypothetical protein EDB89DRAFT_1902058 [Lactarius sanguifluus]
MSISRGRQHRRRDGGEIGNERVVGGGSLEAIGGHNGAKEDLVFISLFRSVTAQGVVLQWRSKAMARAICRAWPTKAKMTMKSIMIRYEASAMTKHDGKRNA